MQTFIGKSESLAQRASLSLQVHKKDKEIQEINIFFDWIEYIRLTTRQLCGTMTRKASRVPCSGQIEVIKRAIESSNNTWLGQDWGQP